MKRGVITIPVVLLLAYPVAGQLAGNADGRYPQTDAQLLESAMEYMRPHEASKYEEKAYFDEKSRKWHVAWGLNLEDSTAYNQLMRIGAASAAEKVQQGDFKNVILERAKGDELFRVMVQDCLNQARDIWRGVYIDRSQYADFDKLPIEARLVALDMLYQLGPVKFRKEAWYAFFPPFDNTIVPQDYCGTINRLNHDDLANWRNQSGPNRVNDHISKLRKLCNERPEITEHPVQRYSIGNCEKSCTLKGQKIDFTQQGWANPLSSEDMYISSGGCFLDPKYPAKDKRHIGVDFLGKSDGSITGHSVYSICEGKVIEKHVTNVENSFIAIKCADSPCIIIYGHIKDPRDGAMVNKNDDVLQGRKIAEIADYTKVEPGIPSHLHLGINAKGEYFGGWGRAKSYETDEKIAEKGWADPIIYLCEHSKISPEGLKGFFATALVIDKSGSMTGDKIKKAKEAAYGYVDASGNEDVVSLVGFASSAQSIVEPSLMRQAKGKLKQDILNVSARGSTNIGSGLTIAHKHLSSCDAKGKMAVLMTDGKHNTGTYKPEVEEFIRSGWPIYTVAFGKDADQDTLRWIAERTNGCFSPADAFNLTSVYHRINVQTHNGSIFRSYSDYIKPGKILSYSIPVDTDSRKIGFFTNWQGSRLGTTLTSPSERVIDRQDFNQGCTYSEEPTYTFYEIDNPQPGNWQVQIAGFGVPTGGEQINFHSFSYSDISSNILAFQPAYSNNQQVQIAVKVAEVVGDKQTSLQGIKVVAEIKKPPARLNNMVRDQLSGVNRRQELRAEDLMAIYNEVSSLKRQVRLYDDGLHGDVNPGDGIYANTYADTPSNGPYVVTVALKGNTPTGKLIDRTLQETFQVGPIEHNTFTVSEFLGLMTSRPEIRETTKRKMDENKEEGMDQIINSVVDQLFKKAK